MKPAPAKTREVPVRQSRDEPRARTTHAPKQTQTIRELLITLTRLEDELRALRRRPVTSATMNRRRAIVTQQALVSAQIRHRAQVLAAAA